VLSGFVALGLCSFSLFARAALAQPEAEIQQAFGDGHHEEALRGYQELERKVGPSADLYYDQGVVHFELRDWPEAILCFERSLALHPLQDDAEQRLDIAREQLSRELLRSSAGRKLTRGESSDQVYWRFFHAVGPHWPAWGLLLSWNLLFGILLWRRRVQHGGVRDGAAVLAVVMFVVVLLSGSYLIGHSVTVDFRPAIVMAEDALYYESPSVLAKTSKPDDLYRGALVAVIEEREEWLQVQLADGSRGWLYGAVVADVRVDRWPAARTRPAEAVPTL